MGKKTKVGKQRKDKFYHLAKETGYRSRAAFKLLQLNRKFEFLQKSRVLVDLCAAPGGWMQVAVQHMPVSSVVIGVDLFPIKSIPGCIGIQEDITTPKCVTLIKKELKTWKADIVLNDGAPNVGQNWIHDAYQQNCLTLSALKLATEILRPGGFFITKVFRSKDYNSLVWVLQQLFRHVYSTKPAASRIESAEIFIVCKGFLAPNTIDPKFLDPKYAFEDVDLPQGKKQLNQLLLEVGKKKKAEGYPTGETLLYKPIKASEFIKSSDHIELLANTSEITIDEEWIEKNPKTTEDIKDYCKDVKVLSKKDIKALVSWRKDLKEKWDQFMKIKAENSGELKPVEVIEDTLEGSDTETKLADALEEIRENVRKEEKRKKKRHLKEIKKIQEKTSLDMIIPGDAGPTDTTEDSLFNLKSLKTVENLEKITVNPEMPADESALMSDGEELEFYEEKRRRKIVKYSKENQILDSSGNYYKEVDSDGEDSEAESEDEEEIDLKKGLGMESDEEEEGVDKNQEFDMDDDEPATAPLIEDLDPTDKNVKRLRKAERWFDKDIFKSIGGEFDEDLELNRLAESYIQKGAKVPGFEREKETEAKEATEKLKTQAKDKENKTKKRKQDFEVANISVSNKKKKKLDIEGLALATVMVRSQKSRRDLMDEGWNRYCFSDPGMPEWFLEDEKKHMRKDLPVPSSLVDEYKNNLKEINARPIKKVLEAKARNKKRTIKKMEKAKKKAEAILDKGEMTDHEKASEIKKLYKKAKQTKKKEVTYVVAKKFNSGKRVKRPAGLKGPMKVVDPRMKKDLRKLKTMTKGPNGKKNKGFKQAGKGKGRGKGR